MISKFPAQRISLQQILIQKWIKENFFDTKLNERLHDKLRSPKLSKHRNKEKEERKEIVRKMSLTKSRKVQKSRDHILPINSVPPNPHYQFYP